MSHQHRCLCCSLPTRALSRSLPSVSRRRASLLYAPIFFAFGSRHVSLRGLNGTLVGGVFKLEGIDTRASIVRPRFVHSCAWLKLFLFDDDLGAAHARQLRPPKYLCGLCHLCRRRHCDCFLRARQSLLLSYHPRVAVIAAEITTTAASVQHVYHPNSQDAIQSAGIGCTSGNMPRLFDLPWNIHPVAPPSINQLTQLRWRAITSRPCYASVSTGDDSESA